MAHIDLAGSERTAHPDATLISSADQGEQASVIVRFDTWKNDNGQLEDFAETYFLRFAGMPGLPNFAKLSGTVSDLTAAFGTALYHAELPDGTQFRSRVAPGESAQAVRIPEELAGVIEAVHGLDTRPVAKPHFRIRDTSKIIAHATTSPFTPQEVAALYSLPADADGSGQSIYIVELGGGFTQSDNTKAGIAASRVKVVGKNAYSGGQGADGEVALDLQIIGATLPKVAITVDFEPNQDAGFLQAFINGVAATPTPAAISCSWGSAESNWPQQSMDSFNAVFQQAAAKGITVFCAAGDNGSGDSAPGNNADFPGSAPWAVSCGGTNLVGSGSTITSETVWNSGGGEATGGGYSSYYARPSYQGGTNPKRGVPDVAANADPATGWGIWLNGTFIYIGGTSAVAPWMSAVAAAVAQKIGKPLTAFNAQLYPLAGTNAFRDITQGNNGAFSAGPGWDACTGNGSINVANLIAALGTAAPPVQPPGPTNVKTLVDGELSLIVSQLQASEGSNQQVNYAIDYAIAVLQWTQQQIDPLMGGTTANHRPLPKPVAR